MDYVEQLEQQNEELKEKLARNEPQWSIQIDKKDTGEVICTKYFLFFNRCLLAMCYDRGKEWGACIYNTLGATDQHESAYFNTLEEAKAWVLKTIYSPRQFGDEL